MITARPYQENPRVWVIPSRVNRAWKLQVRKASCYSSACRTNAFNNFKVSNVYPGLVGGVKTEVIKEKVAVRGRLPVRLIYKQRLTFRVSVSTRGGGDNISYPAFYFSMFLVIL